MQYVFTGFTQDTGLRVFAFEGVARDQPRTVYSVSVDLALSRKYGIRVQELPLLCRGVLERSSGEESRRTFIFGEDEMSVRAIAAAVPAAVRRKPFRPRAGYAGGIGSNRNEEHDGNAGDIA